MLSRSRMKANYLEMCLRVPKYVFTFVYMYNYILTLTCSHIRVNDLNM